MPGNGVPSTLLALLLFYESLMVGAVDTDDISIPGCPNIYALNQTELANQANWPKCYCHGPKQNSLLPREGVAITCIFNANLTHVTEAISMVNKAGEQMTSFQSTGASFKDGFPAQYFQNLGVDTLKQFVVSNCGTYDPLKFDPSFLDGLETEMTNVEIADCVLTSMPEAFKRMKSINYLGFLTTHLKAIENDSFTNYGQLKQLVISRNENTDLAEGSFDYLQQLEELTLGPRTSIINQAILFSEIGKLRNLKNLQLIGASITHLPDAAFENLKHLEMLNMQENDLLNLTKNAFQGLTYLKVLDARVNLIEYLEPGVFMPLENLEALQLGGNWISHIDPGVFSGLTNLTYLNLGWNEFEDITNRSFKGMPNLKELDLLNNQKLQFMDTLSFLGLDNLEVMNLSRSSQLITLTPGLLDVLPNLRRLDLSDSAIKFLDVNVFKENKKLSHLWLNNSDLQTLPKEIIAGLPALTYLDLSENPWVCDEQLTDLLTEIHNRRNTAFEGGRPFVLGNENKTTCSYPPALENRALLSLDSQELQQMSQDPAETIPSPEESPPVVESDFAPPVVQPADVPQPPPLPEPGVTKGPDSKIGPENIGPASKKPDQIPFAKPLVPASEPSAGVNSGNAPLPTTPEESKRTKTAIAIGVIVAALVTVVVVTIVVVIMRRRKRDQPDDMEMNSNKPPGSETTETTAPTHNEHREYKPNRTEGRGLESSNTANGITPDPPRS